MRTASAEAHRNESSRRYSKKAKPTFAKASLFSYECGPRPPKPTEMKVQEVTVKRRSPPSLKLRWAKAESEGLEPLLILANSVNAPSIRTPIQRELLLKLGNEPKSGYQIICSPFCSLLLSLTQVNPNKDEHHSI
jgi:hypothetical protein